MSAVSNFRTRSQWSLERQFDSRLVQNEFNLIRAHVFCRKINFKKLLIQLKLFRTLRILRIQFKISKTLVDHFLKERPFLNFTHRLKSKIKRSCKVKKVKPQNRINFKKEQTKKFNSYYLELLLLLIWFYDTYHHETLLICI